MLPSVAVVGATGAVGEVLRQVLQERAFPFRSIKFLASERSAGKPRALSRASELTVEAIRPEAFNGVDLVFISAPASVSREFAPIAAKAGAVVVDKSSAWRMDPEVPLVVPEVNPEALRHLPRGIVANPNCSTIQMVVALKPLARSGRPAPRGRVHLPGVERRRRQGSRRTGRPGAPPWAAARRCRRTASTPPAWRATCCRTTGRPARTATPRKRPRWSSRRGRSWACRSLRVSPTTVRVPVRVGHSEALNLEFERPISVEQARTALRQAPGVVLLDDLTRGEVPLPSIAEGRDEVFVGRIRQG